MTTDTFKRLEETFGISIQQPPKVNEKLCFNTKLLNECIEHSNATPIKKNFVEGLTKPSGGYYGTLAVDELDLYFLKCCHPVGKELKNWHTGEIDYPKGLQIRKNVLTDANVVENFENIIYLRKWNTLERQIIIINLPPQYWYITDEGYLVDKAIIDGNHRTDAATNIQEEYIIAWLVDMNLDEVLKYGTAVCNREMEATLPRSPEDIINSIHVTLSNKNSTLYKTCDKLKAEDKDTEPAIKNELITDYALHPKSANAIIRQLQWLNHDFTSDVKPFDAKRFVQYVKDHKDSCCKGWKESTHSNYDYDGPHNQKIIIVDITSVNLHYAYHNWVQLKIEDVNNNVVIRFALGKDQLKNIDMDRAEELRLKFIRDFNKRIRDNTLIGNLHAECAIQAPRFEAFPQFTSELKNKKFIPVY